MGIAKSADSVGPLLVGEQQEDIRAGIRREHTGDVGVQRRVDIERTHHRVPPRKSSAK